MSINYEGVLSVQRPNLSDAYKEYEIEGTSFLHTNIPAVEVNTVTGQIESHTRSILKLGDVTRASNYASYNRGGIGVSPINYILTEKGWEVPVSDAPEATVQLNRDFAAVRETKQKIYMALEREAAAVLQDTTAFTAGNNAYAAPADWSDATADILGDISAAVAAVTENSGTMPDTLILNSLQYTWFFKNAEIRSSFGASVITDSVLRSTIPAMFGLKNMLVTSCVIDDAAVGQAFNGGLAWDSDYAMVCKLGSDMLSPSVVKKLVLTDDGKDVVVEEYPEPQSRCNIIRARQFANTIMFNPFLGYLLKVG